ncbi:MAG: acetyl-CoA C-acetyltransferase [Pseudomonadota bacterium]
MSEVAIVSVARTPVGSFLGSLASLKASDLGAYAIREVLKRANLDPNEIDEIVLGQVLSAAQGQNPARQAAKQAGIGIEKTAYQINQVCGSGLRSIALAMQAIKAQDSDIVIAGGQESMSNAPHTMHLRNGQKMGHGQMNDTMISDGLWCAFNGYHMGSTAENIADKWNLTREMQDQFACQSQNKAEKAQKAGFFDDELVPITIKTRKGEQIIDADEYPKHSTTMESLSRLRPAFSKQGTVTAGNASGLNDGAAALILMKLDKAEKMGLEPLARIVSWATAGVDPAIMGTGPIPASKRALKNANWQVNDLDLIESNEAFAAQALAVNQEMKWDPDKVNVNGGSIAIGHPIGASGARITTTLLYEMKRRQVKKGLATLCIGGGMGIAMCFERF